MTESQSRRTYSAVSSIGKRVFCGDCGTIDTPKTLTPGSILIEILLWICFVIPGVIYSLWRMSARKKVCRKCGSTGVLPPDTPVAKAKMKELGINHES